MEASTSHPTVDYSPRDGAVIAAAVWRSERCKSPVGLAEEGLQVEAEAECLGFARSDVSCEIERLRECSGVRIEDSGLCK
jgi:hypothetical protein